MYLVSVDRRLFIETMARWKSLVGPNTCPEITAPLPGSQERQGFIRETRVAEIPQAKTADQTLAAVEGLGGSVE